MQSSVGGGERSTAATAYMHPVASRSNLHILLNAQVTKIHTTEKSHGVHEMSTVEFKATAHGE